MDRHNIKGKFKKRERGENWVQEEKDVFIEIIKQSASIIDNKCTDTNTNQKKLAEWMKIQSKLRKLTGKDRDISQLKGFWRRTKTSLKNNVSEDRKPIQTTGAEFQPSSPQTDFVINQFDIDGITQNPEESLENESNLKGMLVSSNMEFKKRCLKLKEEEHKIKMEHLVQEKIHQAVRHKIELEILLLEKEKKELEIKELKKNLA